MGDIITPILSIVSVLCSSSANNRCCYLLDLQENKEDLNNALVELRATRADVQRRVDEAENNPNELMKRTSQVDIWLQSAQTIDVEVVQVIQKANQEIEGRCLGGYCPKNCRSASKIGKLVLRKLPTVNDLKSKGDLFVVVAYKLLPPLVQREHVDSTVGMESMFEKVWRWLADDEIRMMGLYGCGGVGKTTLLKQINNAFLQSASSTPLGFDVVVILVVVSRVINIEAIQMEIGKRLGLSSTEADNKKSSIFNALSKKNFVLLLDDIWEKVDLQRIGVPFPSENSKSKVIFTTRSETVCEQMKADEMLKLRCLPWDKAWSLFQVEVRERALNSFPRARELAKDVARECGGLPLTLITIGQAMSSKRNEQEWNHAITTLQKCATEFSGMGEKVLRPLKLSYDNLRDDMIKSCFLYCALFPKDHSIDKAKLIDYWIGEGLISLGNHIDSARNHGHDIIGDLKGACLLESGEKEETNVKMQDTIRDMALWIAHESGSKRDKTCIIKTSDFTADERSSSSWPYNAERIYFIPPPHNGETTPPPPQNFFQFKSFLHVFPSCRQGTLPQNFFQFMSFLRVLDLSWVEIYTFPISITELLELRYLSLSWTRIEELPEELRKLVKLNFLDLSHMHHLQKIPIGVIGSLLELRVLNLFDCRGAEYWDIEEVCKLKHLNDFGITTKMENNTLTKLLSSSNKNLQTCTRHLLLSNQYFFPGKQSKDKPQSTIITLEKLQFLSKLETLRLEQFREPELMNMGIEQQQHLGSSCFQYLSQVYLCCCRALKDITWIGYVGNLETLDVYGCDELEEIVIVVVDDFGGSTGEGDEIATRMMNTVQDEVFKRLKTLLLRDQPKLKSICRSALAFPCLETMKIYRCPQLTKLPFDSGSNVNTTLRKIEGGPKWWSELQWEEEEDHNNNNELLKSKFLPYFVERSDHDDESLVIVEEDESLVIVEEDESLDSLYIVEENESLDNLYIVEENESLDIVQIMMLCVCGCFVYVGCLFL